MSYYSVILRYLPLPPAPRAMRAGSAQPILGLRRQRLSWGQMRSQNYIPKWWLWRNCSTCDWLGSDHKVTLVHGRGKGLLPFSQPLCPWVTLPRILQIPFHNLHASVKYGWWNRIHKEASHLRFPTLPGTVPEHPPVAGRVGQGHWGVCSEKGRNGGRDTYTQQARLALGDTLEVSWENDTRDWGQETIFCELLGNIWEEFRGLAVCCKWKSPGRPCQETLVRISAAFLFCFKSPG